MALTSLAAQSIAEMQGARTTITATGIKTDSSSPGNMTLPRMMTQALSARYGDDNLRLVHPAEAVRIERSPDLNTFIMTSVTPDGFAVSFSLSRQQLRALSESGMNA